MEKLSAVEELSKLMEEAGWVQVGDATGVERPLRWSKELPDPQKGIRRLRASLSVYPRTVPGTTLWALCMVEGLRYLPAGNHPHVEVTMRSEKPLADTKFETFEWFEREITAALALLGRGIHE